MTKPYHSFEEIDQRLKVLRLQREIASESLKLNLNRAKNYLYPLRLVGGFSGLLQKITLAFVVKKLSRIFHRRIPRTSESQKKLLEVGDIE